jgi:hypothetical protein
MHSILGSAILSDSLRFVSFLVAFIISNLIHFWFYPTKNQIILMGSFFYKVFLRLTENGFSSRLTNDLLIEASLPNSPVQFHVF